MDPTRARASRAPARYARVKGTTGPDGRTDGRTPRRGDWLYRHRRAWAPPAVVGGLIVTALAGWIANSGAWWLPIVAGGLATAAGLWKADRGAERAYALWCCGGGALWVALAWRFGPSRTLLLTLLGLSLPAAVFWWRHQLTRGRIEVVTSSVRPPTVGEWGTWLTSGHSASGLWTLAAGHVAAGWEWLRERPYVRRSRDDLMAIMGDWPATATNAGIPDSRVLRAVADKTAYTLYVRLRPGTTHRQALDKLAELGSALHAVRGTLRIEILKHMDEVRIRWVHDDPLAAPILYWLPTMAVRSVRTAIQIGLYKDGTPVVIRIADSMHTLVTATTTWGKSSLTKTIVAALASASDVAVWWLDPKDVEVAELAPVVDRLITPGSAYASMRALRRVMQARGQMLKVAGKREWDPELGPYILVILDEFSDLPIKVKDEVLKIAQKGLYVGIRLMILTQVADQRAMGRTTALKGQLVRRISFRLEGDAIAREVFGDRARDEGWNPTQLPARGDFLLKGDGLGEPIDARAYWADRETLVLVGEREQCTRLDATSQAAVMAPDVPDDEEDAEEASEGTVVPFPGAAQAPQREKAGNVWDTPRGRDELRRALEAVRDAPAPVSGNEVMERADLTRHVVHQKDGDGALRELERRGLIEPVEGSGGSPKWIVSDNAEKGVDNG